MNHFWTELSVDGPGHGHGQTIWTILYVITKNLVPNCGDSPRRNKGSPQSPPEEWMLYLAVEAKSSAHLLRRRCPSQPTTHSQLEWAAFLSSTPGAASHQPDVRWHRDKRGLKRICMIDIICPAIANRIHRWNNVIITLPPQPPNRNGLYSRSTEQPSLTLAVSFDIWAQPPNAVDSFRINPARRCMVKEQDLKPFLRVNWIRIDMSASSDIFK